MFVQLSRKQKFRVTFSKTWSCFAILENLLVLNLPVGVSQTSWHTHKMLEHQIPDQFTDYHGKTLVIA